MKGKTFKRSIAMIMAGFMILSSETPVMAKGLNLDSNAQISTLIESDVENLEGDVLSAVLTDDESLISDNDSLNDQEVIIDEKINEPSDDTTLESNHTITHDSSYDTDIITPDNESEGNVAMVSLGSYSSAVVDKSGNFWHWGGGSSLFTSMQGSKPGIFHRFSNIETVTVHPHRDGEGTSMDICLAIEKNKDLWYLMGGGYKLILNHITKVSAGESTIAAIDTNGNLWMWGRNDYGQLGNGTIEGKYQNIPIKIMEETTFQEVSLGNGSTAAIDTNGNLWMWGRNDYGQLGDGTNTDKSTPIKIKPGTTFKEVYLSSQYGENYTMAIDTEDNLWAWGYNQSGQLGDGTNTDKSEPVMIMPNVEKVSLGNGYSAAIDKSGNLWTWGQRWLGDGTNNGRNKPEIVKEGILFRDVTLGAGGGGYAIDISNSLWAWGNYIGDGDNTTRLSLTPVPNMKDVKTVSSSTSTVAVIDMSDNLWMWGYNYAGQLGDGTVENRYSPIKVDIPYTSPSPEPTTEYTVTFNSMGGSEVASVKVTSGESVSKPADPTKTGNSFGGWYKDEECKQAWDFDSDKITENTTLYAKWIKNEITGFPKNPRTIRDDQGNITSTTWDCIWFGHYFQDEKRPYMDKDPIKWRVLSIDENGEALLLSDKNLNSWILGEDYKGWYGSDIREWLNSDNKYVDGFKRNAFSFIEQAAIEEKNVFSAIEQTTIDEKEYKDKVFLPSNTDVNNKEHGFNNNATDNDLLKISVNTDYCNDEESDTSWLLSDYGYWVGTTGQILWDYYNCPPCKIRPAIYLDLKEHKDLWNPAGKVTVDISGQTKPDEHNSVKPDSIVYDNSRWPMNNHNLNGVASWGGFFSNGRDKADPYYINQNDYNKLMRVLKDEHARYRFASGRLTTKPNECDDVRQELLDRYGIDLLNYSDIVNCIKKWSGSCYGMSLTEGLYLSNSYYPIHDNSYKYSLGSIPSIPNTDTPVESEINLYHFMQYTDLAWDETECIDFKKILNKAEGIKNAKDYFMIAYYWNDEEGSYGHSVLCRGASVCDIIGNDGRSYRYKLDIYDPCSSIYDDDWTDIYINPDKSIAYVPSLNLNTKESNLEIKYNDASLIRLASFSECTDVDILQVFRLYSQMMKMIIKDETTGLLAKFNQGLSQVEEGLKLSFHTSFDYVEGSDFGFQGGYYEFESIDPNGTYSVTGGANDKLDVSFEYGDHTVSAAAEATGVTAVFSNNGDVTLKNLSSTDFAINNIYDVDYDGKPGNATKVCVIAKASGDVDFKQSKDSGYELTADNGETLSDVTVIVGTTLKSEQHEIQDAKGKITLTFDGDVITVHEDTNGDGKLDHEETFSDYIPASEVSITPASISLAVGETKTLTANIVPENATDKFLFWSSDDTDIVTVSEGKIVGVAKGTTTVNVSVGAEGKTASCEVTVTDKSEAPDKPDVPDDPDKPDVPDEETGEVLDRDIPEDGKIPDGIWMAGITDMVYTGKAIIQDFRVYDGTTMLTCNVDYTVKYKNNENIYRIDDPDNLTATDKKKAPQILITMKGNYSGKETVYFSINRNGINRTIPQTQVKSITRFWINDISGNLPLYAEYNKSGAKPGLIIGDGDSVLTEGRDYTLKYSGNTKYPTTKALVTITGIGRIKGKRTVPFIVTRRPFTESAGITVVANDKAVGTKAGQFATTVKVFDSEGMLLKAGVDYEKTVVYLKDGSELTKADFPQAGDEITVRVTGKGGYTNSTIEATYNIVAAREVQDISKATLKIKPQEYNKGEAVTITSQDMFDRAYIGKNKTPLKLSTDGGATGDFMVVPGSYAKNVNKGTAKVTFMGINGCTGTKTVSYKIGVRSIKGRWFGCIWKTDIFDKIISDERFYENGAFSPKLYARSLGFTLYTASSTLASITVDGVNYYVMYMAEYQVFLVWYTDNKKLYNIEVYDFDDDERDQKVWMQTGDKFANDSETYVKAAIKVLYWLANGNTDIRSWDFGKLPKVYSQYDDAPEYYENGILIPYGDHRNEKESDPPISIDWSKRTIIK